MKVYWKTEHYEVFGTIISKGSYVSKVECIKLFLDRSKIGSRYVSTYPNYMLKKYEVK